MVRNRPMKKVGNLAVDEIYSVKEVPGDSQVFGLSNWKDGVEITSNRTDCRSSLFVWGVGRAIIWFLKMLNLRYL